MARTIAELPTGCRVIPIRLQRIIINSAPACPEPAEDPENFGFAVGAHGHAPLSRHAPMVGRTPCAPTTMCVAGRRALRDGSDKLGAP